MAINVPGIFLVTLENSTETRIVPAAMIIAHWLTVPKCVKYFFLFITKSAGTSPMCNPKISFTCDEKIMSAIPLVKPTINGCGMNLMIEPMRAKPRIVDQYINVDAVALELFKEFKGSGRKREIFDEDFN